MYLGIDLGTSEVKALVIDENNGVVATHSAPLTIQRPKPHWSEQSPEAWWEATEYLIATLREKCSHHWQAIKAIGLSGQMHGAVLLDAAGEPLRPAILWNDTRCAQECAELEEMAPELHQVAGNLAMPGFTAPKLLWVRRHEPQNFSRLATVLLPKDYLRFKMTGKKSLICRTRQGRCGWMWENETGRMHCWKNVGCRVPPCLRWWKGVRSRRYSNLR